MLKFAEEMSGGIPTFENMTSRRRRDVPLGHTVPAHPIKDSSYMESMVNFFQDISHVYSNTTQPEEKETILWARLLDHKQILDPDNDHFSEGRKNDHIESLVLIVGYKNGIQVWNICDNGDMQEILSLRQGPVKTVCLVPPPNESCDLTHDEHTLHRPLLAICLAADRKQLFTSINIISLRTKEQVATLTFEEDVEQIRAGPDGLLLVTLCGQLQAFETYKFERVFVIKGCYPGPSVDCNPIAVGKKWLAYSPTKQMQNYQSAGGAEDDGIHSYAATVINAAKTIKKGLVNLSETVNWLAKTGITGTEDPSTSSVRESSGQRTRNLSGGSGSLQEFPDGIPGLVTVVNMPALHKTAKGDSEPSTPEEMVVNGTVPIEAIVAHFAAHPQPVVCMEFSPSGSLLATADKRGHAFHVFSILPHPSTPKMGAVHHIYSLYRGDTSARVQGISFSSDCRWLSVNTLRGTSHIFPIASYGGAATVRTHKSHRVVNRSSRFHKSAGLEDMDPSLVNVGAGNHSSSDNQSPTIQVHTRRRRTYSHGSRGQNPTNPRLPPHPQPTLVHPLVQIGSSHGISLPAMPGQLQHGTKHDKASSTGWKNDVVVATIFTTGQLKISRSVNNHDNVLRRVLYSSSSNGAQTLIVFSSYGFLTEYHLEPRPLQGLSKISDDSPIELISSPRFQWPLQRSKAWGEVTLPLAPSDPFLEVDNRRRARINSQLDVTSSITSSLSSGTSTANNTETNLSAPESLKYDSGKPYAHNGTDECEWNSLPKTQQPTSRNRYQSVPGHPHSLSAGKTSSNPYPGTAVPQTKQRKVRSSSESHVIPMGLHHTGDEVAEKTNQQNLREGRPSFDRLSGAVNVDHGCESREHRPSSADSGKNIDAVYDEWLSQVEMVSHEGPARRLWMGPQFCFKIRQSTGSTMLLSSASSALISDRATTPVPGTSGSSPAVNGESGSNHDVYVEELDLHSLKIQTNRSEPMPTPKSGRFPADLYDTHSVTIEAGSGSFDRQGHMLEIGAYGSLEDRRFVPVDNEDKLRERIADAMLEQYCNDLSNGKVAVTRDIRSKSDSSDIVEFTSAEADVLLSVGQFEFDSGTPSLELPTDV